MSADLPARWRGFTAYLRRNPVWSNLFVRLFSLLAVYWWLEKNLKSAAKLPQEAYEHSLILWQTIFHDAPEAIFFLGIPAVALLSGKGRRGWRAIGNGRVTRRLVFVVVATLAWAFSTYDYNHYFDQSHLADRFLLVAFAIGVWFHPAFIFPFLLQTLAIASQFYHPIGHFSWTDKAVPIRALMVFAASLVTSLIWKRRVARDFALVASCVIASHYFIPGIAKTELRWWEHNQLQNLTAAAYANGWLSFLSTDSLQRVLSFLQSQNQIGIWMTMLLEVGAIAFLLHRRVAIAFLLGWIALHTGILLTSGICFWKWIALDASFLCFLLWSPNELQRWLFAVPRVAVSVVIIACGSWFFSPMWLGWYDTGLSYTFEYYGRGESGHIYEISKETMAPYDFYLSQNRLFFLTERKRLTGTYGMTHEESVLRHLSELPKDKQTLLALESELGTSLYDSGKSERCVDFFQRFFNSWNRRLDRSKSFAFRAPLHIWTETPLDSYRGQEALSEVRIEMTTWRVDQRHGIVPVVSEVVRDIPLEIPRVATGTQPTRH